MSVSESHRQSRWNVSGSYRLRRLSVSEKNDNLSVMLDKLVNQSTELDNKLKVIEQEKEELDK